MNNISDEELVNIYNKLLYKQMEFKEDVDICIIIKGIEDVKKSEFFKTFKKLNEEIELTREELVRRDLIKNRLIIPSFELSEG